MLLLLLILYNRRIGLSQIVGQENSTIKTSAVVDTKGFDGHTLPTADSPEEKCKSREPNDNWDGILTKKNELELREPASRPTRCTLPGSHVCLRNADSRSAFRQMRIQCRDRRVLIPNR